MGLIECCGCLQCAVEESVLTLRSLPVIAVEPKSFLRDNIYTVDCSCVLILARFQTSLSHVVTVVCALLPPLSSLPCSAALSHAVLKTRGNVKTWDHSPRFDAYEFQDLLSSRQMQFSIPFEVCGLADSYGPAPRGCS